MRGPRPGSEGALLRPGVLPAGGRAALAAGLADGVPARGDPGARRLRRVRDPRPVGHRGARRATAACGPSRTPAATAACGSSQGRGTLRAGFTCPFHGWCYGPDGANTHVPAAQDVRRAQPAARRHRPHAGALRDVGRLRVDQPRRRRPAAARVHRAGRHDPRRLEGRVAARRVVVRLPPPGELEAGAAGVPGAVPRGRGAPAARHPGHALLAAPGADVRPAGVRRRRAPVPPHDERGHGRHGPRQRRARSPRACATSSCPTTSTQAAADLEPHAQRRGRGVAPRAQARHPRPQRARGAAA